MTTEDGSDRWGSKLRWYAMKVVPPYLGLGGFVDMLFIRPQVVSEWRVVVCFGLIGTYGFVKILERLEGPK